MPLDGANVWLHLVTAAVAGFVAWRPVTGERRRLTGQRRRSKRVEIDRRDGSYEG
jgi:hypothetical protein